MAGTLHLAVDGITTKDGKRQNFKHAESLVFFFKHGSQGDILRQNQGEFGIG